MSLKVRFLPAGPLEWIRMGSLVMALPVLGGILVLAMAQMPGRSHVGPPGPLPAADANLPARLRIHVEALARIGPRSEVHDTALRAAATYITGQWRAQGLTTVQQPVRGLSGEVYNLAVEVPGREPERGLVVVGAHYDTVDETPGADDNASGVAALLELSAALKATQPTRTLRFIAFVNEEPPHFQNGTMGSQTAARRSAERREDVTAMFSLETIGFYRDTPGSQAYPPVLASLYPDTGNFIGFVGNLASRALVQESLRVFRDTALLPSEGVAAPGILPGISWSDHWSYWRAGYPAVMVTDTAPFRNRNYHLNSDRPETLDYSRMAWVVVGMRAVVERAANE